MFLKSGVMGEGGMEEPTDRGTPQGGVISPLLANIYLDKIDKGWKPYNRFGRLIRYADDMIIISKYKGTGFIHKLREMTSALGLTLQEGKTRVVDPEKERFDFLGFSYKKERSKRTGSNTTYIWPTQEAERNIINRVKEIVDYRKKADIGEIIRRLNPVIRGWVNYYKIGNSSKKFGKIRDYTGKRVRKYMRKRRQETGYGYKEYPKSYLYGQLGLYNNYRVEWTKAFK